MYLRVMGTAKMQNVQFYHPTLGRWMLMGWSKDLDSGWINPAYKYRVKP